MAWYLGCDTMHVTARIRLDSSDPKMSNQLSDIDKLSVVRKRWRRDSSFTEKYTTTNASRAAPESAPWASSSAPPPAGASTRIAPPARAVKCVKELVVERDDPKPSPMPVPSPHSVEGYAPPSGRKLRSVEELLRKKMDEENAAVEADVSFACMTRAEYEETLALESSIRLHDVDDDGEEDERGREDRSCDPEAFHGRVLFDDEQESGDEFDGDEFDGDDFDPGEEIARTEPPPRPFLRLWKALKDWITPRTASFLLLPASSRARLSAPYDNSDVGASRCGGLMSMLKMHLGPSLARVRQAEREREVTALLSAFVRTFDFERPMAKFDGEMWLGMTTVMIGIVVDWDCDLVCADGDNDGFMTREEWRYLLKDAIVSLGKGSA